MLKVVYVICILGVLSLCILFFSGLSSMDQSAKTNLEKNERIKQTKEIERSKESRIILLESKVIKGTQFTLIKIDSIEYFTSDRGGIIKHKDLK